MSDTPGIIAPSPRMKKRPLPPSVTEVNATTWNFDDNDLNLVVTSKKRISHGVEDDEDDEDDKRILRQQQLLSTTTTPNVCYFDELIGQVRVGELNNSSVTGGGFCKEEFAEEKMERYDLAKSLALSSWNEFLRLSRIMRREKANATQAMLTKVNSAYQATLFHLAKFFNVPSNRLEVGPMGYCTLALAEFDTLWLLCKRDFCYDDNDIRYSIAAEFLKYAETFLEDKFDGGGGTDSFCAGLVDFLRKYMMWQVYPQCDNWIQKIESKIDTLLKFETLGNMRRANGIMKNTLSYDFTPEFSSSTEKITIPSALAGQWIRMK